MLPKVEYCNWSFEYLDKNKWLVERDCGDEITLIRGGSRNWKAYEASLKPRYQNQLPLDSSKCLNCLKYINGVNPYDDGETWRK